MVLLPYKFQISMILQLSQLNKGESMLIFSKNRGSTRDKESISTRSATLDIKKFKL